MALQEDDYVRNLIAPAGVMRHSTFFDRVTDRGVEQILSCVYRSAKTVHLSLNLDLRLNGEGKQVCMMGKSAGFYLCIMGWKVTFCINFYSYFLSVIFF